MDVEGHILFEVMCVSLDQTACMSAQLASGQIVSVWPTVHAAVADCGMVLQCQPPTWQQLPPLVSPPIRSFPFSHR